MHWWKIKPEIWKQTLVTTLIPQKSEYRAYYLSLIPFVSLSSPLIFHSLSEIPSLPFSPSSRLLDPFSSLSHHLVIL
ncbi:hypothetical protein VNO78_15358 [Psophocarpus tetragonolobus]|uniref:Uncharacterized protein n=1 Tax=Psophocarpus tetragonolobus TaxID=3891 RepID=A0AAN9SFX8_PSOTE